MISARLVLVADEEELPRALIRGRALSVTRQAIVVQCGNRERAGTVLPRFDPSYEEARRIPRKGLANCSRPPCDT